MYKIIIISTLLAGIFYNVSTMDLYTLNRKLIRAVKRNKIEKVQMLIEQGACINAQDDEAMGRTSLHIACASGNKKLAQLLITLGANVNSKDFCGMLPINWVKEKFKLIKLLIDKGTDINAKDKAGCTTLFAFIFVQNKDAIQLLISSGADVNAQDITLETSLHRASAFINKEIVELLLDNGADKSKKNYYGATAADLAKTSEIKETINNYVAITKR